MPTAAIPGFNAVLAISTDGGSVYNTIGELKDFTLTIEHNLINATSKDSAGWEEMIPGLKKWSISGGALYLNANAGQDAAYDALVNGTKIKLRMRPRVSTGWDQYVGDAYIDNWEIANPLDDAVAVNVSATGTGALTNSNQ